MDGVYLRNNGSEFVVNTTKGDYVAYGPLEPGREKFDVQTPEGKVVKMTQPEFFKLVVQNAPNLVRSPEKDMFESSQKA